MEFRDSQSPLTEVEIAEGAASYGLRFPRALRELYLSANGGVPDPYVFENDDLDTVVCEFLPLVSVSERTAIQTYQTLVVDKALVPPEFFPFAVDGGGNYFFTDSSSEEGAVYFYRGDSSHPVRLLDLHLGITEFWQALKPE